MDPDPGSKNVADPEAKMLEIRIQEAKMLKIRIQKAEMFRFQILNTARNNNLSYCWYQHQTIGNLVILISNYTPLFQYRGKHFRLLFQDSSLIADNEIDS